MSVIESLPKPVILIVDSDSNELKTLRIGFDLEGFIVHDTNTGSGVFEICKKHRVDVALVDLMMPEINGLELARKLRTECPGLVTVLMSAYHLSPVQLSRANTGAVGFVPKPCRFETLVQFIRDKLSADHSGTKNSLTLLSDKGLHSPFDVPQIV